MTKPLITGTTHTLPFEKLSPDDFERLCLWLVEREGCTNAKHLGAAGREQGRDITAWREGTPWAFQCKRVKSFGPKDALEEVEKVLGLPEAERPAGLMFFVTCNVSADTREQAGARCAQAGVTCDFWAGTELDAKVKRHPEIVKEFFQIAPPMEGPSRVPFVLPQLDVSTFTGRDEELRQLEELLVKREGPRVCSMVGLVGAGGIGKSALACHFAGLHKDDFPDGVTGLRVDGKDVDTIAREFARCCGEEIDPEDEPDASTVMQDVFRHRQALLIFDNADDAIVRLLLPGGDRCTVIVTTRDRLLPASLDIPVEGRINLPPLPDPDSLRLLERLLGEERIAAEREAVYDIIELVGNLPLALQIVGAALQMQEWRSLADYVASLSLARLKIRGDEYLDVRASFSLSLELLEPQEIDFFACLSVCAQDGFSVQGAMAAGNCDESTAYERLAYLYRLSLLNRVQSGSNRFVFHSLIRLFAQDLAVERALQDDAAERHARFFIEFIKSSDVDDRAVASILVEELDDIILAAEWLLRQEKADYEYIIRLHPFFQQYGHWRQAADLTSGFLSLAERMEHWDAIVRFRIQQAKYLSLLGDLSQAQQALAPIADIVGRIEAEAVRQRSAAMWLNTLGGVLQRQGHFDEAEDAFQRSIEIGEKLGDKRHLAMVLNSLGGVLRRQGRFDEAVDILQRSYDLRVELEDQRGQAMVLNSLGGVLRAQGHFDEAVDAFQRSIQIGEKLGDKRHLAMVLNSLGGALQDQGRFDEAVDALQCSAAIEEQLGNQLGQAMVLNSLGGVLQRQGRFDEALDACQRSMQIGEEVGDKRHLAIVLNKLGGILQDQGHFDEAVDAFQRSYAISKELDDQRSLAMVLNSLGGVLQRQGRFDEAVDVFRHSLDIGEELDDRRGVAEVLNSLGRVLQRQGRFDEAVDALQRSLDILEEIGDRRGIAMVLNSLGRALQDQRRFDEAIDALQRSLEIREKLGNRRDIAMVLNSLGRTLQAKRQFNGAISAFQRSLDILEELGDERSLAMVLNSLGGALQDQGRFDEAVEALQRSAAIEEQLGNQRGLAMVHYAMGKALLSHGDIEKAAVELSKSFEINEGLKNRRGVGIVTPVLVQAIVKLGQHDEALAYCQRALAIAPRNRRLLGLRDQLSSAEGKTKTVLKQGSVKRLIQHARGYRYGFITPDDGSPDIYFREGYIDPDCLSRLAEGVRVEVEVEQGPKGPRAKNVKLID